MPVRPTLELGHPLLRQTAEPVADPRSAETRALITDLWDTLDDFRRRHGWGRALAAPVISVPQRVIVIAMENQRMVLINPRFESWSRDQVTMYESCITFGSIWGAVSRPRSVVVVALDENGEEQRFEVNGDLARVMQHEIDHLDGFMWLDRDPDLSSICTTTEYMRQRDEVAGASSGD
jgi:peptide deformylase